MVHGLNDEPDRNSTQGRVNSMRVRNRVADDRSKARDHSGRDRSRAQHRIGYGR